ncbi:acyltransferase family protein [Scandinavium manionii]|uniref:acyltransferase family protein n=1 Tax=Scandinavium manionii TaxID=2926520 RepID=UPI0035B24B18
MYNLRSLTGIRGIAALYVILYHFTNAKFYFLWNGYLAVDLFFILSGFIMTMVYKANLENSISINKYLRFLYHRFARIYPLYVSILIFMIWEYTSTGSNLDNQVLTTNFILMQGLFGGGLVGASWSVSVEIIAYIFFPIILLTLLRHNYLSVPLFIISFLGIYSLPYLNTFHSTGPLDIYNGLLPIARGGLGFLLGVSAFFISENIKKTINSSVIACDIIFAGIVFVLFYKGFDMLFVLMASIYIPFLYHGRGISQYILALKPIHFLGEISFSMYLTHLIFQRHYGKEIYDLAMKLTNNTQFSDIFLMLFLTISVSTATYYLIERPARTALRKIEGSLFN